ncbi:MAG TPA: hypothetical protein VFP94_07850 [Terriglobales bacterium]|nr:hypothetical protein [Terriglobales bacterium]
MGALMELRLEVTSSLPHRYGFSSCNTSRWTLYRVPEAQVTPAEGWHDPLAEFISVPRLRAGSNPCALGELSSIPISESLWLNQWARFDRPGVYRVTVTKEIHDNRTGYPGHTLAVVSSPLAITITPDAPGWHAGELARLDAILGKPSHNVGEDWDNAVQAVAALGGEDAAAELARWCGTPTVPQCAAAMVETGAVPTGIASLHRLLADPDHAVTRGLLGSLVDLELFAAGKPLQSGPAEDEQSMLAAEFVRALPAKRGAALDASLVAAVEYDPDAIPDDLRPWLTQAIADRVGRYTPDQRAQIFISLAPSGAPLAGPAALALLRQEANDKAIRFSAHTNLLHRWYDLDPAGARPQVIAAIEAADGWADDLGFLPDATLPEADQSLLAAVNALAPNQGGIQAARLIGRYGSAAIATAVAQLLDQRGDNPCEWQAPLVGYLLRAAPALAPPRRQAMAMHCGAGALLAIAGTYNDPWLQPLALHRLQDADTASAEAAARYLGRYGDAAVKAALTQRWAAVRAQALASPAGAPVRGLYQTLAESLIYAQAWATTPDDMRRLADGDSGLEHLVQPYIEAWSRQPWTIGHRGAWFTVLQYTGAWDQLLAKLAQLPSGSAFVAAGLSPDETRDLAAYLRKRGDTLR